MGLILSETVSINSVLASDDDAYASIPNEEDIDSGTTDSKYQNSIS